MKTDIIITILVSVMASTGFWAFLTNVANRKSANTKLTLGLAHDRIMELCLKYLERGWMTTGEYDNLYNYLYVPYEKCGGNGTAARLMKEVQNKVEIRRGEIDDV